jgi:hypothetical protein
MSGQYHVRWSDEDREYVGLSDKFPSISHLAPTYLGAMLGIMQLTTDMEQDIYQEEPP